MTDPRPADVERLRRLHALLDQALDLPAGEREAWLDGLGPEHSALREPLRDLLRSAGVESDDFMKHPAASRLGAIDSDDAADLTGKPHGP